jgi:hypothetical protein
MASPQPLSKGEGHALVLYQLSPSIIIADFPVPLLWRG